MTNIDIIKKDLDAGDKSEWANFKYSMTAEGRFILNKEYAIHSERGFIATT